MNHNELKNALSGWGFSWSGLIYNKQGEWWLICQLLLIGAHLIPLLMHQHIPIRNWPIYLSLVGSIIFFLGILLAIRALSSLGESLSPLPDPKQNAKLVTNRAYRLCRHPLYQSILISSIGVSLGTGSPIHLVLFCLLCIVLKGKAKREEEKLSKLHGHYEDYKKDTPAIIPLVPFLDWRH
ncbi:isoprenylcysteine carboxylmethyltransferase family protein [Prochlorococcus sp. MIT 1300]|uniref:methyltransferase family protein n=1 Tax=Prochlorococcus sp. MIT 1300 TaxID=3096218 RepID=UPI002A754E77|nr:isoprenylcysteine carboxylmethyltransferase family protein [Prochlorococcus sp. MIT 1300]